MPYPNNTRWEGFANVPRLPGMLFRRWRFYCGQVRRRRHVQKLGLVLGRQIDNGSAKIWTPEFDAFLQELLDIAEADPGVQRLMRKFELARNDMQRIYGELIAAGCAEYVRGHFVPASTLVYANALGYYLNAPRGSWKDIEAAARQLLLLFQKVEMRRPYPEREEEQRSS